MIHKIQPHSLDKCHISIKALCQEMYKNVYRQNVGPFFITSSVTHQCLVFDLLSDQLVLTQGITCLSSDGIYGSLLHLLFDGTKQHEERLASTLLCFGRKPRD